MRYGVIGSVVPAVFILFTLSASPAAAQDVPWDVFSDAPLSSSVCDLVNAGNMELVVLSDTGELMIVSGSGVILEDTFVDASWSVFFEGEFVGIIGFAEDGDGFRTLWWTTLTGEVVDLDEFTFEPLLSGLFPSDFVDVPCDACDFWGNPMFCAVPGVDSDLDGVEDAFDLCPNTPFLEIADDFGCSCSQLDSDLDDVDDCFDLCPNTPFGNIVDSLGCTVPCSELDSDLDGVDDCIDMCPNTPLGAYVNSLGCVRSSPPPVVGVCGSFSSLTLAMMFCGLVALRAMYRPL
jgi:hypothetical protein